MFYVVVIAFRSHGSHGQIVAGADVIVILSALYDIAISQWIGNHDTDCSFGN